MTTFTVRYHNEDGTWWAELQQEDGFTAAGASLAEVSARMTVLLMDLLPAQVDLMDLPRNPSLSGDAS